MLRKARESVDTNTEKDCEDRHKTVGVLCCGGAEERIRDCPGRQTAVGGKEEETKRSQD